ncbi:MAG: Tetratricopeptide repeat-like domain, partial [Pseudomonadota bacterium]
MREDLEQQEQLDAIKGFWQDNKKWIVPALVVVLVAAVGFNGWTFWQNRQANAATDALTAME